MRITEWKQEQSSQFYVDTLCLPISPLWIQEKTIISQEFDLMEKIAQDLEKRLTGRLLLLPSISYVGQDSSIFQNYIRQVLRTLENSGFTYLILLYPEEWEDWFQDLTSYSLQLLLCKVTIKDKMNDEERMKVVEGLIQQVIQMWI